MPTLHPPHTSSLKMAAAQFSETCYRTTILHDATTQKTTNFIFTTMKTWDLRSSCIGFIGCSV